MQKRRSLLLLCLPALFLAGCGTDDFGDGSNTPSGQNGDITFDIGFTPQTRVSTDAAFTSTWENGDEIGIFAVAHAKSLSATTAANYINNAKLTYSGGTWTQAEALYWPTTSSGITALDFYAYYPYDAAVTDPTAIAFNVLTDQSGMTNSKSSYNLSDLLTAKADNTGTGSTVSLTFTHALSLVQVEVPVQGKGFGPSETLVVRLRGVKACAILNLSVVDGITPGTGVELATDNNDALNILMHRVEESSNTTSYTYRALVPAQAIPEGASMFWFEHEERQFINSKALTSGLTMTGGKAKLYEIPLPQALQTVHIPSGEFLMGSSDGSNPDDGTGLNTTEAEPGRNSSRETQHKVTLTKDFYMGKYEVTNAQYVAFLNAKGIGSNGRGSVTFYENNFTTSVTRDEGFVSSHPWGVIYAGSSWEAQDGYENHPVIMVTWYGAKAYADWVGGALPTEAQWEYACRGGIDNMPFGIGDGSKLIEGMGNYNFKYSYDLDPPYNGEYEDSTSENYLAQTEVVGKYAYPNGYYLYDMHGNVWEWCSDWYNANYGSSSAADAVADPTGPEAGTTRVLRGGSWVNYAQNCRSAYRINYYPVNAFNYYGFRVVFVP